MAQQTALQFLIEELKGYEYDGNDFIFTGIISSELIEQAKQMEKEQIENAYNAGSKEIYQDKDNAAWYYFKTYVKEQQ